MLNNTTISSLHRPYQSYLWVARWVCEYYKFYRNPSCSNANDSIEFYFFLLERMRVLYRRVNIDGEYISERTVKELSDYFGKYSFDDKRIVLQTIIRNKRNTAIEKHIYSTYRAATYAINLAKEKLELVDGEGVTDVGNKLVLRKSPSIRMMNSEKNIYLRQILRKDFYFFIPFCVLSGFSKKGVTIGDLAFGFSKQYHPVSRFNYTHCSHKNYISVRQQWTEQLGILTGNGTVRKWFSEFLKTDVEFSGEFERLMSELASYKKKILREVRNNEKKNLFYSTYCILKDDTDITGYVGLYDMMKVMKMPFGRFQKLLQEYYEAHCRKENIFLVNIIGTMDTRKRFAVRNKLVMKIKIIRL